jgi:hypothetical protein
MSFCLSKMSENVPAFRHVFLSSSSCQHAELLTNSIFAVAVVMLQCCIDPPSPLPPPSLLPDPIHPIHIAMHAVVSSFLRATIIAAETLFYCFNPCMRIAPKHPAFKRRYRVAAALGLSSSLFLPAMTKATSVF